MGGVGGGSVVAPSIPLCHFLQGFSMSQVRSRTDRPLDQPPGAQVTRVSQVWLDKSTSLVLKERVRIGPRESP